MHANDLEPRQPAKLPQPGLLPGLPCLDRALLCLCFGALLGLSSPGFDLWWLAWFALVPLLVLVRTCRSKLEALVCGAAFGAGYHLVCLSFLLGLYPLAWLGVKEWPAWQEIIGLWLFTSFHQAILIAGFSLFTYMLPMRAGLLPNTSRPYFPYLLSVPLLWIFFQWMIGGEFFMALPLAQLAYSQSGQHELIQIAKLGGSQLVDFLIVFVNAAASSLLLERAAPGSALSGRFDPVSSRTGAAADLLLALALVAAAFFWGKSQIVPHGSALAVSGCVNVPVAVIEADVKVEDEQDGAMSSLEIAGRYGSLIDHLGVPLLVLPEGAAGGGPGAALLGLLRTITSEQKKEALVGSIEKVKGKAINILRLVTPREERQALYVKQLPVGEYMPPAAGFTLKSLWPSLIAGGSCLSDRPLLLPRCIWGKVGASIGLEIIYPRLISRQVRDGASLLVNVSNLSWFHNSALSRQVLAASVFRAVENGRFLVLASNTGVSAVIDPSGFVSSASVAGLRGCLVDTVQFHYKKTPFSRMWWL